MKTKYLGPGEHDWGFVEVRPGAHMFWLLYYTTNSQVSSPYEKPLVIWLQGGPGGSGTGYGNFAEIGPVDVNLRPRNYTWVKECNVLFIDNPVGAGFSYVDSEDKYATNNTQIADDLVNLMKSFLEQKPGFRKVPTYIFGESYGGKMGVEFALAWHKNLTSIESNLKGLALGDASISAPDIMDAWAPFLLQRGLIDADTSKAIEEQIVAVKKAMSDKRWREANQLYNRVLDFAIEKSNNISIYNVLEKAGYDSVSTDLKTVEHFMIEVVKELLNMGEKQYHIRSSAVYDALDDCRKPVFNMVEELLNETDLKVFTYSGEFDFLINSLGTYRWSDKLSWKHAEKWRSSDPIPIYVNGVIEAWQRTYDKFSFFRILHSGHMAPKDNPAAMLKILNLMISNSTTTS
ncbi:hypothetical protein QAD02_009663 [Eretmocerus hayati]|uniref:Uncharacterized protein n=1 Tax=Eretmocerus hayati TaxID=131215 RepID=A0ACC2NA32_9HYME|nr:hypothetical protein QAD02_009663 [Eretmocerus hayati]